MTMPDTTPASTTAPSTSAEPRRGGGTWRHLLAVVVITLLVAVGIAFAAGAFRGTPTVAMITSTEDVYWDRVLDGARAAAAQFEVNIEVVRSRDQDTQGKAVQDLLSRGVDAIGISPVNADAQTPLINGWARRAKVITFDSDAPNSARFGFVGTDNYVAGRHCGEMVREALPDGGEVVICVGSVDNVNGRARRQGLIDNLLDRPLDPNRAADPLDAPLKGEKYTVVATLLDGGDPAKAVANASDALKQHGNLKCMVGLWSYSAPSILEALKGANKLGQVKVVAFDEAESTLAGIEAGHIAGTLVQDQYNMGYDAVRLMIEEIKGVPPAAGMSRMQYLVCRPVSNAEEVEIIRYEKTREKEKTAGQGQQLSPPPSTATAAQ